MKKLNLDQLACPNDVNKVVQTFILKVRQEPPAKHTAFFLKLHKDCGKWPKYEQFLADTVQVCISNQFQNMQHLCHPSCYDRMRQFYFKTIATGTWKNQHQFNLTILYTIKMVCSFFIDSFADIQVTPKLEAQIFVILMHVLLGIKVCTNTLELLQKKYLKQGPAKQGSDKQSVDKTFLQRRRQLMSVSFCNTSENRFFARVSKYRKTELPIQPIDEVQKILKQNLYVAPLPQITKQKKQIHSSQSNFAYTSSDHSTTRNSNHSSVLDFSFDSTQLSSSMRSQLIRRKASIARHNRPLKLNQRAPFQFRRNISFEANPAQTLEKKQSLAVSKDKLKQEKLRASCHQWKSKIERIKEQFYNLEERFRSEKISVNSKYNQKDQQSEGLSSKRQIQQNNQVSYRKQSITSLRTIRKNEESEWELMKPNKSKIISRRSIKYPYEQGPQNQMQLQCGVKNFKEIDLSILNNDKHEDTKRKIKRKALIQKKKVFDSEAIMRNEKIQHTIFMLPSNKFKEPSIR